MIVLLLFLLLLCFFILFIYLWYRFHKEIGIHTSSGIDSPKNYGLSYEDFTVTTKDNYNLSGWYIPAANPKAFIILLHGRIIKNGGKSLMLPHAAYLHKKNYATILFDLRGVGESDGKKITLGVHEWKDASAVYAFVKTLKEAEGKKVGFMGISMGAVVSIIASGREKIGDFIIAAVPYKSFVSLFTQEVREEKFFPQFIFVGIISVIAFFELGPLYFLFDPSRLIASIKVPIFLISAKNDREVDPKDAWDLYTRANKPKDFWQANTSHDVYRELQKDFEDRVINFLQVYT